MDCLDETADRHNGVLCYFASQQAESTDERNSQPRPALSPLSQQPYYALDELAAPLFQADQPPRHDSGRHSGREGGTQPLEGAKDPHHAAEEPSDAARATAETGKEKEEKELEELKQRFLAMDDWTGAKRRKPLRIRFPQEDPDAPVWGWGERDRPPASPEKKGSLRRLPLASKSGNVNAAPRQQRRRKDQYGRRKHGEKSTRSAAQQSWDNFVREALDQEEAARESGTRRPEKSSFYFESRSREASGPKPLPPLPLADSTNVLSPASSLLSDLQSSGLRGKKPGRLSARAKEATQASEKSEIPGTQQASFTDPSSVLSEQEERRFQEDGIAILSSSIASLAPVTPVKGSAVAVKDAANVSVQTIGNSDKLQGDGTAVGTEKLPKMPLSLDTWQILEDSDDADSVDMVDLPPGCLDVAAGQGNGKTDKTDAFLPGRIDIQSLPDCVDDPIEDGESDEARAKPPRRARAPKERVLQADVYHGWM